MYRQQCERPLKN